MSTSSVRQRAARPAYMDGLFSPKQSTSDNRPRTPSLSRSSVYSSTESFSAPMSSLDNTASAYQQTRPLTPACEEEAEAESSGDDSKSVISLSLSRSLKPRFKLRNLSLHRRSDPSITSSRASRPNSSDSTGKVSPSVSNFFHGKRHSNPASSAANKPLPPLPVHAAPQTQELTCHRCYYFAARNCKGWTMGGSPEDACETCLQAGFFGAP